MKVEIIKFKAKDGIKLDGFLYSSNNKKILIQIHGMTSNCFKDRDKVIAKKMQELSIDTLCFNNRGSEIIRYIKGNNGKKLAGMAYEDIEESYYDIVGAIEFATSLGYNEIILQGHSLGSTKIVYTYNMLKEEMNPILNKIKAIILLSLVDIPEITKIGIEEKFIKIAEEKEKIGEELELMPHKSFIHPISTKTFLKYIRDYENIDFAKYDDKDNSFNVLNKIGVPIFMRWGNVNELIKQNASDLVSLMNNKIINKAKDINYIDGADHSYHGKEEELADEIASFIKKYVK